MAPASLPVSSAMGRLASSPRSRLRPDDDDADAGTRNLSAALESDAAGSADSAIDLAVDRPDSYSNENPETPERRNRSVRLISGCIEAPDHHLQVGLEGGEPVEPTTVRTIS